MEQFQSKATNFKEAVHSDYELAMKERQIEKPTERRREKTKTSF